ncbi:dihydrolipoamide acetyltransferase family protein [Pseudomonas oryzihabitans]|uniref:Dihydrolipoamide acetyltransferase component of pyruvate dehydrogenase complex n=1 Tax=Pseudomonas oryzihabitans TaxID=47885 RepID=A0AAJ2BGD8_9PSED|nr:dihydrolipoamide acetyltransferase family protein [Pseudomonas psychrotolerans]MDR6232457.1 2-oxoisovalerate dehydrogenase E2 component (dihydrolipoyl transacylase) [Pseudomonas psychrotolerans]MDR6358624.1 2-oxoisovalerate dehydrogenase E2 component (dihydrolipoyl transacylase) [Pseudomonas psychrotolerans]
MGTHVIKMPDIGEGIAEVELVKWYVAVGDEVSEDQTLADVMTDKAMVEIPSPVVGRVLALGGEPGQVLAVGAELIRLEVAGDGNQREASRPAPVESAPAPKAEAPKPEPIPSAVPSHPAPAAQYDDRPTPRPTPGSPPLASPAVRQHAWDLGIELRFVTGSGQGGRILHGDLDAYVQQRDAGLPPSTGGSGLAKRSGEERLPLIGLRRKIAEKMQTAKRHIPHFTYVEEVDVTELEALRASLNQRWQGRRAHLTLLPFLARALVVAVRDFPQMNARFDEESSTVTRYGAVHLGIATQGEQGLAVPVVRHAEALDLWGCAQEVARLATAVRAGKASRDELGGSTLTISSLGPLGGIASTPIINHPEVAIIGVNRIVERPAFRNGLVVPRKLMNLSASFDHRLIDGQDAASFIQAVRQLLEQPATLFLE